MSKTEMQCPKCGTVCTDVKVLKNKFKETVKVGWCKVHRRVGIII